MRNKTQTGSAFFYILLTVVLFAALAFTVSRSMRGSSTSTITDRQAELAASEIMAYSAQIAREVDRLRRKGISESDIDFSSDIFSRHQSTTPAPWDANPNCTDDTCRVFSSQGGRVRETTFESAADEHTLGFSTTLPRHGHPAFYRVSAVGSGTDAEDLVLEIIHLNNTVCEVINQKLNLPAPATLTPEASNSQGKTATSGDGYWNFENTLTSEPLFDEATELQGKVSGCFTQTGGYGNIYFTILIER